MKKLLVGILVLSVGQAFAAGCDIDRDAYGRYFVSQNGRQMSNPTSSVASAHREMEQLERHGVCREDRRDRRGNRGNRGNNISRCTIETDAYSRFLVKRNGSVFSSPKSSFTSGMTDYNELVNLGLCAAPSPQGTCELERDAYGRFAVRLNGQKMSNATSSLSSAVNDKNKIIRNNICYDEVATSACDIKRDAYGRFMVTVNGATMSSASSSVETSIRDRSALIAANVCYEAHTYSRCEIERDAYGRFHVSVNGEQMSSTTYSASSAASAAQVLASANLCQLDTRSSRRGQTVGEQRRERLERQRGRRN